MRGGLLGLVGLGGSSAGGLGLSAGGGGGCVGGAGGAAGAQPTTEQQDVLVNITLLAQLT